MQPKWDDTPGKAKAAQTPGATPGASTRMWESTPGHATPGAVTPGRDTPGHQGTPSARRNRWAVLEDLVLPLILRRYFQFNCWVIVAPCFICDE